MLVSAGGDVDAAIKIGRLLRKYLIRAIAPVQLYDVWSLVNVDKKSIETVCRGPDCICAAMRNQFGWDAGRGGFHLDAGALIDGPPAIQTFIEFIVPGTKPEAPHWQPPPGPKLLPAPPRMYKDELGIWREEEK